MTFLRISPPVLTLGLARGPRAVGWLDSENDFPTRSCANRILRAASRVPNRSVAAGSSSRTLYPCPFCRFTGGPSQLSFGRHVIQLGSRRTVLVIPSEQEIFAAPSMVAHYIDAHDYSPPQPFVEAVLKCPAMRSMPYLRLLRAHGATAAPARTTPSDAVSSKD